MAAIYIAQLTPDNFTGSKSDLVSHANHMHRHHFILSELCTIKEVVQPCRKLVN